MGSVWRAEHLTLNSPVAVKLLEPAVAGEPLGLARFMREARAAAKLRSPHVVQILDHGVDEGVPYIAMELLEGEPLANRLAREGRLSLTETVRIITHIARALSRAHAVGIIHRDLKPDNVFLTRDDDDQQLAKLLDFGIVKSLQGVLETRSEQSTGPGILVGTPYYASPEQAQGTHVLDHRSDVWALGVIAFECLIGERPFRGESLGDVLLEICVQPMPVPSKRGPVPPGFDEWFAKVCARPRDQRFESAKLAASELAKLCEVPTPETRETASLAIPVQVDTPLESTVREPRFRHSRRSTFAGVLCALLLTVAALASMAHLRTATAGRAAAFMATISGADAASEEGTSTDAGTTPPAPRMAVTEPAPSLPVRTAEPNQSLADAGTPERTPQVDVAPLPPQQSASAKVAPAAPARPLYRPRPKPPQSRPQAPAPGFPSARDRSSNGVPDYGI